MLLSNIKENVTHFCNIETDAMHAINRMQINQ